MRALRRASRSPTRATTRSWSRRSPASPTGARTTPACWCCVRHARRSGAAHRRGRWHGTIVDAPRGDGGFGYDPHFLDDDDRPHRRRASARAQERAVASRQGDARADRPPATEPARRAWLLHRRDALAAVETSARAPRFAALPPLALYVHIPWCVRKCPYCDFNSHEARGDVPEDAYVDALIADLETRCRRSGAARSSSVFIGGGTPSLFSPEAIDRLLAGDPRARCRSRRTPRSRWRRIRARSSARSSRASARRASTGCRSACRASTRAPARARPRPRRRRGAARRRGGARDLRQREPRPHVRAAASRRSTRPSADLAAALAFAPPHLSFYHLTLEPNTLFHRHPPPLPDDDTAADIEDAVEATLGARRLRALRDLRLRAAPATSAATTSTTGASATTSASAPARIRSCRSPTAILRQMRWKQPRALPRARAARRAAAGRDAGDARATSASSSC